MNTLGINLGTSSVKVAWVGEGDQMFASASRPLNVSSPQPGFSGQAPKDWWRAVVACIDELHAPQCGRLTRDWPDLHAAQIYAQRHGRWRTIYAASRPLHLG